MTRARFEGSIAAVGSSSGVRAVVGRWWRSPFGPFADAMVESATGHRVLVAPSREIADHLAGAYRFDEVRVEPVTVGGTEGTWWVESPSLRLMLGLGGRTPLGRLLRLLPPRLATHPAWATAAEPLSRVVLRGVRARGAAAAGRRAWYGATDVRRVVRLSGSFDGADLGSLAPVDPPCRFGLSSAPRQPSVTDVVTTQ